MFYNVRLALRQLAAAKGFTITAMLTLALGIGANTGIFTLINALMLKSLPAADPQRIVRIGDGDNCCVLGGTQEGRYSVCSYALYRYLREHTPEFEDISAFQAGRRANQPLSTNSLPWYTTNIRPRPSAEGIQAGGWIPDQPRLGGAS